MFFSYLLKKIVTQIINKTIISYYIFQQVVLDINGF